MSPSRPPSKRCLLLPESPAPYPNRRERAPIDRGGPTRYREQGERQLASALPCKHSVARWKRAPEP